VSTQIQVLFTIAALFRISKFLSIKSWMNNEYVAYIHS
jgi:hypothetical protein